MKFMERFGKKKLQNPPFICVRYHFKSNVSKVFLFKQFFFKITSLCIVIYVCVYLYMCVCIYICVCVYMYIYIYDLYFKFLILKSNCNQCDLDLLI